MSLSSLAVHVAPKGDVNDDNDDDAFSPLSPSTSSLLPSLFFHVYLCDRAQLVAYPNGRLRGLTVRWLLWGVRCCLDLKIAALETEM